MHLCIGPVAVKNEKEEEKQETDCKITKGLDIESAEQILDAIFILSILQKQNYEPGGDAQASNPSAQGHTYIYEREGRGCSLEIEECLRASSLRRSQIAVTESAFALHG